MRITTVITTVHADKKFLYRCLKSVEISAKKSHIFLRHIVVANGTSPPTLHKLLYPTTVLRLKKNIGFGQAIHLGMLKARSEWCLIVAPDTIANKNTLQNLIPYTKNTNSAIAAPKIYYPNHTVDFSIIALPTIRNIFLEQSYLYKIFPSFFHHPYADSSLYAFPHPVQAIASTFWLINRKKYLSVGGFDKKYFLFFDDTDLCERMYKAGYQIIFEPNSTIVHEGHQSNYGQIRENLYIQGLNIYLSKYHSSIYHQICLNLILLGSIFRLFYWTTILRIGYSKKMGVAVSKKIKEKLLIKELLKKNEYPIHN